MNTHGHFKKKLLALALPGVFAAGPALAIQPPTFYGVDFVATAAFGVDMNDAGDVVGTSYRDTGCGSTCLPPLDTVVWRDGVRVVLPSLPGLTPVTVTGINNNGWISGYAGFDYSNARGVVWEPSGTGYLAQDVGLAAGTTMSFMYDIDDTNRGVGFATTVTFPPTSAPIQWTQAGGLVNLASQGAPSEEPLALSPGGTVATATTWYSLDNLLGWQPLIPSPAGFYSPGNYPAAINDQGDQVRFLQTTTSESLSYLFRYKHQGEWQQIWPVGSGLLLPFGVGSVNADGDITATAAGTGIIAYGPDGMGQSLASLLSPAYLGAGVTVAGPMNASGEILARVTLGQSARVVKLVPIEPCTANCIRVSTMQIKGKFINDPSFPGSCTPAASNKVQVTLTVKNEAGAPMRGVTVSGRFLDDYWTNKPVSARTNSSGIAKFSYSGLACVGAVVFLVDNATGGTSTFDRSTGELVKSVIPLP